MVDLKRCLVEAERIKVEWFDNRDDAHGLMLNAEFDLCISDFNVPHGCFSDTQELCKELNLPLLLMSGETWDDETPCPNEWFIEKPFSPVDLILQINKIKHSTAR